MLHLVVVASYFQAVCTLCLEAAGADAYDQILHPIYAKSEEIPRGREFDWEEGVDKPDDP